MTTATVSVPARIEHRTKSEITRARATGVFYLLMALVTFLVFGRDSEGDATLRLTDPGDRFYGDFPDLVFNASSAAYLIAVLLAILGGIQITRGFDRWQNAVLAIAVVLFVGAFLGWAAAGASFSLVGMLQASTGSCDSDCAWRRRRIAL